MRLRSGHTMRDVAVVGVGGQGIILATDVIATAFLKAGFDVKKSEVHGMAQRGGSVQSHIRIHPERVHSPLIPEGSADVLLALEKMEALRHAGATADDGLIIYSTVEIPTPAMSIAGNPYPRDIDRRLEKLPADLLPADALGLARELGDLRVANTVLVGALSLFTDVPQPAWEEVLSARVPPEAVEVNLRAFAAGRKLAADSL
ncbi:MAG: indolepyruvate oxidoreductase subunit beta [Bacillota bacterium]